MAQVMKTLFVNIYPTHGGVKTSLVFIIENAKADYLLFYQL